MDVQLAKLFRDRWLAVEAVEAAERETASIALRWQQLNSLWRLAIGLGLSFSEPDENKMVVYQRWARLKGILS